PTSRPCSSNTIRSARRTVEKRCEMYTAVRPWVSERSRSNRSYSACASSADVGSSRSRMRAFSRMNARASATFCHSPPDRLTPASNHLPRAVSEEHTSELQSRFDLVCRLLLEKKKNQNRNGTLYSHST